MTSNDAARPRPYIMLGYLRGLFDYLRARGAPLEPVLERLQLTEDQLRDPDIRVDHALQDDIFAVAETITGDVNVGLHSGEATHLIHFGILGQLAMTCHAVRDLVDLHTRFQRLISTGARITYRASGDEMVGESFFEEGARPSRHTIEYTLASHTTLARLMTGLPFSMSRLEVSYAAPEDGSEQDRLFACPIQYGCERERFAFPLRLLDLPLLVGDSASRRALEVEARRRLDALLAPLLHGDPELIELKAFIAAQLPRGAPDVQAAARAVDASVRTLQRRLERLGLSYRELLDLVRRERAEVHVSDPSLSQIDIAFLLGYADQSTFHRAFRRWFDLTPGEYRALRRGDASTSRS